MEPGGCLYVDERWLDDDADSIVGSSQEPLY